MRLQKGRGSKDSSLRTGFRGLHGPEWQPRPQYRGTMTARRDGWERGPVCESTAATERNCPRVLPQLYSGMKTAISLPDDLFKSGDSLAKRMGVSRSELYARALAEFVAKHRSNQVTQRLNAVYADEESRLDASQLGAQLRSLPREEW